MLDNNNKNFEELSVEDKFSSLLKDYKKQVKEQVLFDVLVRFYFADWTRKCDYDKMSSENIVESVMNVCKQIEKDYNYDFNDDIMPTPFTYDREGYNL